MTRAKTAWHCCILQRNGPAVKPSKIKDGALGVGEPARELGDWPLAHVPPQSLARTMMPSTGRQGCWQPLENLYLPSGRN